MDIEQLITEIFEALSRECYYEIVEDRMFEEIGIHKEDVVLPRIATEGSAGADFFAPFDISLKADAPLRPGLPPVYPSGQHHRDRGRGLLRQSRE